MKNFILTLISMVGLMSCTQQPTHKGDVFKTSMGDLYVYHVGHGSVMLTLNGKVIQVDPYSAQADYDTLPKADLVLITHEHGDHLDSAALAKAKKATTKIIATATVAGILKDVEVLANGESTTWNGIKVEAVPAYNVAHLRPNGQLFHPKGAGNGYVLTMGDFKLYIAGDTENISEMGELENVNVAFLPKNLPYTMTDDMFVAAAKSFKPQVAYVYHYFELDNIESIKKELSADGVEVRVFEK
jgi:L-ascorbate metabolism protein UlaG (beta-lactamase superfamily)